MSQRTILNSSLSGHLVKMSDPEGALTAWDLEYSGLTDEEMGALEVLFSKCEGRLRSFWFVDPFGNLLRWTDNLDNAVWETGMLVSSGVDDPHGGRAASRFANGGQAPQSVSQVVDITAPYKYTFSVWARSESADSVRLLLSKDNATVTMSQVVSTGWELLAVSGAFTDVDGQISCAIEVPAGSAIDLYGPQCDAQSSASGYRSNSGRSGVYLARFDQDELERTTLGPDNHSTRLRVVTVKD